MLHSISLKFRNFCCGQKLPVKFDQTITRCCCGLGLDSFQPLGFPPSLFFRLLLFPPFVFSAFCLFRLSVFCLLSFPPFVFSAFYFPPYVFPPYVFPPYVLLPLRVGPSVCYRSVYQFKLTNF